MHVVHRRLVATIVGLGVALSTSGPRDAAAENRIAVRGIYYREPSTRVVQPMVEIEKDLPNGYIVGAHFLLDAITSASIAQGAKQDIILNERRSEVRFNLAKTIERTTVGIAYRHSQEPDYLSDTVGLGVRQGIWQNTGMVGLSLAYGHDRLPQKGPPNDLRVYFAGMLYDQVLSPTVVAQLTYDFTYQNGFLANPYLRGPFGPEAVPTERIRHAPTVRVAKYFPTVTLGLQLHYRFYFDQGTNSVYPWGITSQTVEGRVYKGITRDLEARVSYRYSTQTAAQFWCNALPVNGGDPGCYTPSDPFKSVDEKLGNLGTHYPELRLTWDMRAVAGVPVLGWFSSGAADVSYGRYLQSTHYGDAHLLQVGYALSY